MERKLKNTMPGFLESRVYKRKFQGGFILKNIREKILVVLVLLAGTAVFADMSSTPYIPVKTSKYPITSVASYDNGRFFVAGDEAGNVYNVKNSGSNKLFSVGGKIDYVLNTSTDKQLEAVTVISDKDIFSYRLDGTHGNLVCSLNNDAVGAHYYEGTNSLIIATENGSFYKLGQNNRLLELPCSPTGTEITSVSFLSGNKAIMLAKTGNDQTNAYYLELSAKDPVPQLIDTKGEPTRLSSDCIINTDGKMYRINTRYNRVSANFVGLCQNGLAVGNQFNLTSVDGSGGISNFTVQNSGKFIQKSTGNITSENKNMSEDILTCAGIGKLSNRTCFGAKSGMVYLKNQFYGDSGQELELHEDYVSSDILSNGSFNKGTTKDPDYIPTNSIYRLTISGASLNETDMFNDGKNGIYYTITDGDKTTKELPILGFTYTESSDNKHALLTPRTISFLYSHKTYENPNNEITITEYVHDFNNNTDDVVASNTISLNPTEKYPTDYQNISSISVEAQAGDNIRINGLSGYEIHVNIKDTGKKDLSDLYDHLAFFEDDPTSGNADKLIGSNPADPNVGFAVIPKDQVEVDGYIKYGNKSQTEHESGKSYYVFFNNRDSDTPKITLGIVSKDEGKMTNTNKAQPVFGYDKKNPGAKITCRSGGGISSDDDSDSVSIGVTSRNNGTEVCNDVSAVFADQNGDYGGYLNYIMYSDTAAKLPLAIYTVMPEGGIPDSYISGNSVEERLNLSSLYPGLTCHPSNRNGLTAKSISFNTNFSDIDLFMNSSDVNYLFFDSYGQQFTTSLDVKNMREKKGLYNDNYDTKGWTEKPDTSWTSSIRVVISNKSALPVIVGGDTGTNILETDDPLKEQQLRVPFISDGGIFLPPHKSVTILTKHRGYADDDSDYKGMGKFSTNLYISNIAGKILADSQFINFNETNRNNCVNGQIYSECTYKFDDKNSLIFLPYISYYSHSSCNYITDFGATWEPTSEDNYQDVIKKINTTKFIGGTNPPQSYDHGWSTYATLYLPNLKNIYSWSGSGWYRDEDKQTGTYPKPNPDPHYMTIIYPCT
jgi:hypothetical protein